MRLIDVEELKKCIKQVKEFLAENLLDMPMKQEVLETVDAFVGLVESMPTVDAEPVRPGKWWRIPLEQVGHPENKFFMYRCSECKATSYEKHNYCPQCGAKMDGGDQK